MMKHTTTGKWKLGLLLSLMTAFLWSITPIAIKIVLNDMDPYTIAWYRFLISTVLISIWIFKLHRMPNFKRFRGATLWLTILTIFGLSLNYAFFMIGLKYIPPSTAAVVVQLAPMFLLFGSILVFGEKYNTYQSIGFFILVFGLILFFNMRINFLLSGFSSYALGILLIVCSAVVWSIYALAQKQLLISFPSEIIMLFIYSGCCLLFTPFSRPSQIIHLSGIQLLLLIFVCVNTFLAYGSFSEALNHFEASRVSAVLAIIPLLTIICMKIIFCVIPGVIDIEPLNLLSFLGAFMVVLGSMTSTLSGSLNK